TVTPPRFVSGCRAPEIPQALSTQAATIRIEVRLLIGIDGSVQTATIVSGSPLVPDESILTCVRDQRYEPAALPDGTRVPFPLRRRFVFRPDSL
ncbi:MAG: energy transducer TonB, partial [Sandaracinaceae bacterium]|nr:energy transducer TonB [Sandaracinaceae bacterium]